MEFGKADGKVLWTFFSLSNHDYGPNAFDISTEGDTGDEYIAGSKLNKIEDIDHPFCDGQTVSYNFSLENAAYLWNIGATSDSLTIEKAESYWLTVDQNGCSASDSLRVSYQPAPVVHLGSDTTICEGTTLTLSAGNNNTTYV